MASEEVRILALTAAAQEARKHAHAPYSAFFVGAIVEAGSGKIYSGCNIENASYGLTVCAERVAILKAASEGEREIKTVVIVAGEGREVERPCGACLQVMQEFAPRNEPMVIVSCTADGVYETHTLGEYLPMPFRLKK